MCPDVIVILFLLSLPSALPGYLNCILAIVFPYLLLADGCYPIPPSSLMSPEPTIHYQPVIYSVRVWKNMQHMSLAHIVDSPVIIEIVCLSLFDCCHGLFNYHRTLNICSSEAGEEEVSYTHPLAL